MALVAFALIGGLVLASALCVFAFLRAVKRHQREAALHAPLLDSDAQEQPRVCALCAFENPSRYAHCVLCGSPLPPLMTETEGASRLGRMCCESLSLWRWLARVKTSTPTETTEPSTGPLLTTRQLRARNRKEWTRVIDDQQRLVWRRQPREEGGLVLASLAGPSLGVVVTLPVDDKSQQTFKNQSDGDDSYFKLMDDDADLQHIVVVDDIADALELVPAQVVTASLQLVEVDDGHDALVGHPAITGGERITAFSTLAALDFPSKYAHFVTVASTLLGEAADQPRIQLKISRDNAYDESMTILSRMESDSVRAPISVQFQGESGVDAGGLFRDWLTLMCSGLAESKSSGVFVAADTPDEAFHLRGNARSGSATNNSNDGTLASDALAAGRFVGRSLLEGYPLGFHLSLPLLKMVLGVPVTFGDLEFLDTASYRSLVWLLENDQVDALALDFTVSESDEDGNVSTVELVAGGADMAVTDANKREFVRLKFRHLVFARIQTVVLPFLTGVYEAVPADLLMMFDPEELDYMLSGSDEIDVDDWRRNTKYSSELQGHMALRWFWELVREMPNEYRRRLLRFATGSSRVPLGGFAALTSYDGRLSPFTLIAVSYLYSGGYIRSHACFNRLDLPLYMDRDDLKRMLFAILESEGDGFTME